MSDVPVDIPNLLNELIETCMDGESGFRAATERVKDASLKSLFQKYAAQRASYAFELQQAVAQLGGEPSKSGHIAAALHRGWINLKEAFANDEDRAIVSEAEAGEDAAVKAYREALSMELPANLTNLIQTQLDGIQQSHATVRELKLHQATSLAGGPQFPNPIKPPPK